jgi:uncharacterized protein (TIGR00725 family)
MSRRPVVGVMGSGTDEHRELAEPLGRWLAHQGVHLLTGGGHGVMAAVARAFAEVADRAGLVIGVVPGEIDCFGTYHARSDYPNAFIELAILTHLPVSGLEGTAPMSRNHINVLSSDLVVALPGGAGTASETVLALRYGRPLIAYLGERGTIPDLAPAVPLARTLGDVERFVYTHLGLRGQRTVQPG